MNSKILLALGISLVFVMGFTAAMTPKDQGVGHDKNKKELVLNITKNIGKNATR